MWTRDNAGMRFICVAAAAAMPVAMLIGISSAHAETGVPGYVQCSEDCKGLCATCGTNLNESTCSCTTTTSDSRWDALLKHQSKSH